MLKTLNKTTQKFSAVVMTGIMMGVSNEALASSASFKSYTQGLATKTESVADVVTYISYIGGVVLAGLGIVGLKNHVENPSQEPMKNGLAKLGFGGMLLAFPTITDALQTDATGAGTATFSGFNTGSITF